MTVLIFLVLATAFLAYSNGANDNFKGVATLFGSKTTRYKAALSWATVMTFAGSLTSIFFSQKLIQRFSGKGLVPDALAASPEFLLAVAVGAGGTVILATLLGFPISTTHSLTGALVGSGLVAAGMQINISILGTKFFLPLLFSPLLAAVFTAALYFAFCYIRICLGVNEKSQIFLGNLQKTKSKPTGIFAYSLISIPDSRSGNYRRRMIDAALSEEKTLGISTILNIAHYLSAGVVSFARGLNDTPKIVALLIGIQALGLQQGMLIVAIAMAMGGVINARKVAETISNKITPLNPGQGFAANFVTGLLVVFASRWGMPVSTTHVSVGSILGIGSITKKVNRKMVVEILLSWVLTLPIAAIISATVLGIINAIG
jgi:PiT family inorganic phosphate transporter